MVRRGTACILKSSVKFLCCIAFNTRLISGQPSKMNTERSDLCLISSRLASRLLPGASAESREAHSNGVFDCHVTSLYVHRAAARPASGADIEAGLPGWRDIRGQLHVQPSTACCTHHVAGERQAGEYCASWNDFFNVCATYHNYSWHFVRTLTAENVFACMCAVLSNGLRSRSDWAITVRITVVRFALFGSSFD